MFKVNKKSILMLIFNLLLVTTIILSEYIYTSYYDIFMFNCLRTKTFTSKADYDFWKEKAWLNSDYFYYSNSILTLSKPILNPINLLFI
jgi:hypothetical protein